MGRRLYISLTAADPLALGATIDALAGSDVDGLHLDLADGIFVPELTFGLRVVRAVRGRYSGLIDVHLMLTRPEPLLDELGKIGVERVAAHLESLPYPWRFRTLAARAGVRAGLAVNPSTPLEAFVGPALWFDYVNLLTTEPDEAGEQLLPGMAERVAAARRALPNDVAILVDGGVDPQNLASLLEAGANEVVVGRAVTSDPDPAAAVARLRSVMERVRH